MSWARHGFEDAIRVVCLLVTARVARCVIYVWDAVSVYEMKRRCDGSDQACKDDVVEEK